MKTFENNTDKDSRSKAKNEFSKKFFKSMKCKMIEKCIAEGLDKNEVEQFLNENALPSDDIELVKAGLKAVKEMQ